MKFKIITVIVLLILLVVFALQNAEIVQIKLLFWTVAIPEVLLILVSVSLGIIIGMISLSIGSKRSRKEPETEPEKGNKNDSAVNNFFE